MMQPKTWQCPKQQIIWISAYSHITPMYIAILPYVYSGAVLKQRRKWSITSGRRRHGAPTCWMPPPGKHTTWHYMVDYYVVEHLLVWNTTTWWSSMWWKTTCETLLHDGTLFGGTLRVKHYYIVFYHVRYVVGRHLLRANASNVASEENIPASYAPHSAEYKRLPSSKSKSSSCCFTNLQHKSSLVLDSTRFYALSFLGLVANLDFSQIFID